MQSFKNPFVDQLLKIKKETPAFLKSLQKSIFLMIKNVFLGQSSKFGINLKLLQIDQVLIIQTLSDKTHISSGRVLGSSS